MIEFKHYKDGKRHVATFSYDDSNANDYRLAEILTNTDFARPSTAIQVL